MGFSLINGMDENIEVVIIATYVLNECVNNVDVLGSEFIENNKNNFKMCVDGKNCWLVSEVNVNELKELIKIKLSLL